MKGQLLSVYLLDAAVAPVASSTENHQLVFPRNVKLLRITGLVFPRNVGCLHGVVNYPVCEQVGNQQLHIHVGHCNR